MNRQEETVAEVYFGKSYVGTGLVPVLSPIRTATRAVPTLTTQDSIWHFQELSNNLRMFVLPLFKEIVSIFNDLPGGKDA
jgi:hypothetical protein